MHSKKKTSFSSMLTKQTLRHTSVLEQRKLAVQIPVQPHTKKVLQVVGNVVSQIKPFAARSKRGQSGNNQAAQCLFFLHKIEENGNREFFIKKRLYYNEMYCKINVIISDNTKHKKV